MTGREHNMRYSLESIARQLEGTAKLAEKVRAASAAYLTPYQAMIKAMLSLGYSPLEISDITGLSRSRISNYAGKFKLRAPGSQVGYKSCHWCDRIYMHKYVYCPMCGKEMHQVKPKVDAYGEPM